MESERSINRIGIGIEKNDLSGIEIFIYIYKLFEKLYQS